MSSRVCLASRLAMSVTIAGFGAVGVAAQQVESGAASPLFACRTIADDQARLACFDREVSALQTAEAKNEVVIVDKEEVTRARRDLFGFALPKIGLFRNRGEDEEAEEIERIESSLAAFRIDPTGRAFITLGNGARWMQTDSTPVLGKPKMGDMVVIETAALGSFKASIGGRRAIRVKRVN